MLSSRISSVRFRHVLFLLHCHCSCLIFTRTVLSLRTWFISLATSLHRHISRCRRLSGVIFLRLATVYFPRLSGVIVIAILHRHCLSGAIIIAILHRRRLSGAIALAILYRHYHYCDLTSPSPFRRDYFRDLTSPSPLRRYCYRDLTSPSPLRRYRYLNFISPSPFRPCFLCDTSLLLPLRQLIATIAILAPTSSSCDLHYHRTVASRATMFLPSRLE